jgi:hypothetical protein
MPRSGHPLVNVTMPFTYKIRNAEEGLKKISLYVDEDAAV